MLRASRFLIDIQGSDFCFGLPKELLSRRRMSPLKKEPFVGFLSWLP